MLLPFSHKEVIGKGSGPVCRNCRNCGIQAGLWSLQNHTYHSWIDTIFAKKSSEKACLSHTGFASVISVLKQPA